MWWADHVSCHWCLSVLACLPLISFLPRNVKAWQYTQIRVSESLLRSAKTNKIPCSSSKCQFYFHGPGLCSFIGSARTGLCDSWTTERPQWQRWAFLWEQHLCFIVSSSQKLCPSRSFRTVHEIILGHTVVDVIIVITSQISHESERTRAHVLWLYFGIFLHLLS